jgi:hypothetical protein
MMKASITACLTAAWRGASYTVRWIVALVRVAHRYAWRTKLAMFNAPAHGNLDEFKRVYGNYHRSIVHLLVGDIEAALEDPPPPYPHGWGF